MLIPSLELKTMPVYYSNKVRHLLIFIPIIFISCNSFKRPLPPDVEFTDAVVIDVNKTFDFTGKIPDLDLAGVWVQHSAWIKLDSTWKGLKSLDVNYQYNFNPNGVFHYYKVKKDSLFEEIERGDYELLSDQRTLSFMINEHGDTLFQHGDTLKYLGLHIYSLNDSIIRLEGCFFSNCEDEEFIEFRRK